MNSSLDTLRGSVNSQGEVVAFDNENDWEALGDSPRYTLEELLHQCDPSAPEDADMIAWQNFKKVGREE